MPTWASGEPCSTENTVSSSVAMKANLSLVLERVSATCALPLPLLQSSIALKLIVPFALAVTIITASLGGTCCALMQDTLNKNLLRKAGILTNNLHGVISDPFSMGEWTRVQKIFEAAQNADADIKYIVLVSED